MLLNEVMQKSGLSKKAIQYYEDKGLITPVRLENGYRDYDEQTLQVLKEIAMLRNLSFDIHSIKIIIQGDYHDDIYTRAMHQVDHQTNVLQQQKKRIEQLRITKSILVEHWDEDNMTYPYFYTKRLHLVYGWINLCCFLMVGFGAIALRMPALPTLMLPFACVIGGDLFMEEMLLYKTKPYAVDVAFKEKHLFWMMGISMIRSLLLVSMLISAVALNNQFLQLFLCVWTLFSLWFCFRPIWKQEENVTEIK